MSTLKEIKTRIASVRSTLKITSAMKMVSSAKLHRAQQAIGNMLPYQKKLQEILSSLNVPVGLADDVEKKSGKVAIVAFSSNSSLCGAFNSNAFRHLCAAVDDYSSKGFEVDVYAVGKKIEDLASKAGMKLVGSWCHIADRPNYKSCTELSDLLVKAFAEGEYSQVLLVYNHFASSASQPSVTETYLPMEEAHGDCYNADPDIIYEPGRKELAEELLPKVLKLKVYSVALDADAAGHAARTVAMQMASDNAEKLLGELTLDYNKRRQQAITSELLDIVGGTMA